MRRTQLIDCAGLFTRGMGMGAADIVPGISGGTIALISGMYERLIEALGSLSLAFLPSLVRGRWREARERLLAIRWGVLLPVFLGVAISIVAMSRVIPPLMEDHPGETYAFFFGLIAATVWVPFSLMRSRSMRHVVIVLAAAAGAWLFVGMRPDGVALRTIRHDPGATTVVYPGKLRQPSDLREILRAAQAAFPELTIGSPAPEASRLERIVVVDPKHVLAAPSPGPGAADSAGNEPWQDQLDRIEALPDETSLDTWLASAPAIVVLGERRASMAWIFVCGVLAISAMILPGVSGAFLLLFLGQYHAVLGALHGATAPIDAMLGRGAPGSLDSRVWLADALFLGVFLLGVLVGLSGFSRVVRWTLTRWHDATMAALTGLMIGALRQPAGEVRRAGSNAGLNDWLGVVGMALLGVAIVILLNRIDALLRTRRLGRDRLADPA